MVTVFEQGDILFLNFTPQSGHEQRGRRPAVVVSNNVYNHIHNLLMVCPITNTDRDFPSHVRLDSRTKTTGTIMCDQVRALDVSARNGILLKNCQMICWRKWLTRLSASLKLFKNKEDVHEREPGVQIGI